MTKRLELQGKKIGRLKVLRRKGSRHGKTLWECKCDCGNIRYVIGSSLMKKNHTTSCGCLHKERTSGAARGLRPHEATYNKLIANQRKYDVDLAFEDFVEFTNTPLCHYCRAPILWKLYCATRYNLDRKDNTLGYSKDNCVVCCLRCNRGKMDLFTYDEWWAMTKCFREKESDERASQISSHQEREVQGDSSSREKVREETGSSDIPAPGEISQ